MRNKRGKTVASVCLAIIVFSIAIGAMLTTQAAHAAATTLKYKVDSSNAAGGVYARYAPHTNSTKRIYGYGVWPNETVQLLCGVTDGDPVGPYTNHTWHFVTDLSNLGEGNFWLSDHYVDSPNVANHLAPGESTCKNESSNPLQPATHLPCTPILVIGARGSGEPYAKDAYGLWGFDGPLSPLANGLIKHYGKGNVTAYGLPYPADPIDFHHIDNAIFSNGYQLSVKYGVEDLTATVTTQVQACPFQLIDLVGYSQGADVINSTIPLLSRQVRDHINGVVTFGDPQFNAKNAEDRGSYDHSINGIKALRYGPRHELPGDMLHKARSYCDDTDYICNPSAKSIHAKGHFAYATTHVPEAMQFLASLTIVSTGSF